MTRDDIASKVAAVIAEKMQKETAEINESLHLDSDLGASSLDLFDIVTALEEEFDVQIDDETAGFSKETTVKEVIDFIYQNLNGQNSD